MKKAAIIGHFGEGHNFLDGQTVKTKTIAGQLERVYGRGQIFRCDTYGGKTFLLKSPFVVFSALKKSENVIILPAQNGLRVIAPLLVFFNRLFHRRLHYAVIGGWLPRMLEKRKFLSSVLRRFDHIYVETAVMKRAMETQGFCNVEILPNCKDIKALSENELQLSCNSPYRLCTFSRVMQEKGIEDAVNAVRSVNEKAGEIVCSLDIYGQIDAAQTEWFEELQRSFPNYIAYKGAVDYAQSVDTVKNYCALLFPTRFYTEGIPGTIIDAYAAGVPVIASRWESFADIISEGVTGTGYEFGNSEELRRILEELSEAPERYAEMKKNCLSRAQEYLPDRLIHFMTSRL